MKLRLLLSLCLLACLCAAQTTTPAPTYVGGGVAWNQLGTPPYNLWATAVYPVASSIGLYLSTSTDLTPVWRTDAATQRQYLGFTPSLRQGVHKLVYQSGKLALLVGGDAGAGFRQDAPAGVSVSFAGSATLTALYQIGQKWAVVVPVRALYADSAWRCVPQVGLLFRP